MQEFRGRTAFVTGGASGIGLAMGAAFGELGMQVMLADVEAASLDAAVARLRTRGIRADGVQCDVRQRASMQAAADATVAAFGNVHVVCNNAGVSISGAIGSIRPQDWDWIIDVNLKGVVHGVEVFTPLIEAHGDGGHFVNTASMGGLIASATHEPYIATKFAVVGMSEGWAPQLAAQGIGMTILCPGFVRTRIHESRRNQAGGDTRVDAAAKAAVEAGIAPETVAAQVVAAIRDGALYVFSNPGFEPAVRRRFDAVLAAFARTATSTAVPVGPTP